MIGPKTKTKLMAAVISPFIIYLLTCFIQWNPNPEYWGMSGRVLSVFVLVCVWMGVIMNIIIDGMEE